MTKKKQPKLKQASPTKKQKLESGQETSALSSPVCYAKAPGLRPEFVEEHKATKSVNDKVSQQAARPQNSPKIDED